jgi:serine phosphatase RsbU (regulator of sigma subunit)
MPGRVWQTGDPAWIHEVEGEGNFPRRAVSLADGLHGAFAFPFSDRGEFQGVIELLSRDPRPRDEALIATMQRIGEELGEFLARRRADDERRVLLVAEHAARLEAEAARAELVVLARTLQESLLPSMLPEIPGVALAAWYEPFGGGADVGGDFYDVFRIGRQRWGVVLGDVCGKGPEAARLTALARYTIRAAAMQARKPSVVLRLLNETLLRDAESRVDSDRFITAAYGTLQRRDDRVTLTVSLGGHPPPVIRRATGAVEIVDPSGVILGLLPDVSLRDVDLTLDIGDTVILYTDGLTDVQRSGTTFGDAGLDSVLRRSRATEPAALLRDVERAALGSPDAKRRDDIAVLALQATSRRTH